LLIYANEKRDVVLFLASHKDITHTKMLEMNVNEECDSGKYPHTSKNSPTTGINNALAKKPNAEYPSVHKKPQNHTLNSQIMN